MKRFLIAPSCSRLLTAGLAMMAALAVDAADVATTPAVGGMILSISAGGTRAVSLPLAGLPSAQGAVFGRVVAVGPDYVDAAGAGWSPGVFLPAVNPYYLRLRNGAAAGRVFLVQSNTASRLYLNTDGSDLSQPDGTTPGAGDAFELVPADTLASLFSAGTLLGGESAALADNVQVWGGSDFRTYYFNNPRHRWEEAGHPEIDCGSLVLRPDRGFLLVRHASSELRLTLIGRVAEVAPVYWHARPGVTLLATGSPVDLTLGGLGLQTRAAGWRSGDNILTAFTDADLLEIPDGAPGRWFYFDRGRQHWQLAGDAAGRDQDGYVLPAGAPVMIHRLDPATAASDTLITMPVPGDGP